MVDKGLGILHFLGRVGEDRIFGTAENRLCTQSPFGVAF